MEKRNELINSLLNAIKNETAIYRAYKALEDNHADNELIEKMAIEYSEHASLVSQYVDELKKLDPYINYIKFKYNDDNTKKGFEIVKWEEHYFI